MKNTFENQVNDFSVSKDSLEWKQTKVERMNKYQIIRNNFITLLIFNFIDLFGFSFACLFYQWFKAGYTTKESSSYMWVNFLYIKHNGKITFMHENYDQVYIQFCQTFEKTDYNDCITGFNLLKKVGIAAFSFVVLGLVLHILEIIRLFYILNGKRNKMCLKAFFLHPLILISLSLPILLYIFMIIYLVINQENGHFSFGPSFYVASGMFVFYFIVLIYYKQQKKRLEVHETMDKLLIELNRSLDQSSTDNKTNKVISSTHIKSLTYNTSLSNTQMSGKDEYEQNQIELQRDSTFVL